MTGLSGSGHRYRYGYVDIAPATAAATTLEVVNSVRIHDEYLLGIGEVSNSWPGAALQAQVLASRTYALARTAVRAACRCQVDNGAGPYHDQTFAGWSKESGPLGANWQAAVASTWASPATMATTGLNSSCRRRRPAAGPRASRSSKKAVSSSSVNSSSPPRPRAGTNNPPAVA